MFSLLKNIIPGFTHAKWKRLNQGFAFWLFRLVCYLVIGILVAILAFIIYRGIGVISWGFITENPKNGMTEGGIFPAIVGTSILIAGSIAFAFPVGVLSAIYIHEYTRESWFKRLLQMMTNNLAGVPSIVFGLFGMALFVNQLNFGASILAGSLTLGLLVLPVVIRNTEEALKAVDDTYRHASYGVGASKWQTIRKVVIPIAMPNIITGLILSVGRVSGETAPILFTVAAYSLPHLPHGLHDQVMALPYHLYVLATSGTDARSSRDMAYGTALVLVIMVLIVNLFANFLRKYLGRKVKR